MKVGVFGDSYVDPINGFHKILGDIIGFDSIFNKRLTKEQFISKPWIAYNDNFTSHGRAGSDISYSVQKFLKHQHKYDKVIFFITSFYRLSHYTENEWTLITNSSLPKNSKEKVMVDYLNYIVLDNIKESKRIIIDTKFTSIFTKTNFKEKSLKTNYIYQIYAYLMSQQEKDDPLNKNSAGMLLHPAIGENIDESANIQGHDIKFSTVDLTQNHNEIKQRLLELIS
mgnify:CR=1 FL=1